MEHARTYSWSISHVRLPQRIAEQAKPRFNILLNILQPSYIAAMFLRAVFSMFVHQMIFFHVYHLKDDIQLSLRRTPEQSC